MQTYLHLYKPLLYLCKPYLHLHKPYLYLCKPAAEWLGEKEGEQNVIVEMNVKKMLIEVKLNGNELVRSIDMTHVQGSGQVEIHLSADAHLRMVLVKVPKEYDLVSRSSSNSIVPIWTRLL